MKLPKSLNFPTTKYVVDNSKNLVPAEVKRWDDELIRVLGDYVRQNATSTPVYAKREVHIELINLVTATAF